MMVHASPCIGQVRERAVDLSAQVRAEHDRSTHAERQALHLDCKKTGSSCRPIDLFDLFVSLRQSAPD